MKLKIVDSKKDMLQMEEVAKAAFSSTSDASLDEWLSFSYMKLMIEEKRGLGLLALNEEENSVGVIYAKQENPINGKEGLEKWVIVLLGVDPKFIGKGIGSFLLKELEKELKDRKIKKLFTFTNKSDEEVIHFYRKNGFHDAGWIKDYQYGKDNSAVFLLKYL